MVVAMRVSMSRIVVSEAENEEARQEEIEAQHAYDEGSGDSATAVLCVVHRGLNPPSREAERSVRNGLLAKVERPDNMYRCTGSVSDAYPTLARSGIR